MSHADTARELSLYMENDAEVYRQMQSIIKNLDQKVRQGKYDSALAPKLWMYLVDFAAERYTKEYGDVAGMTGTKPRDQTAIKRLARQQFPTAAREIVAKEWAEDYEAHLGDRGLHIHKDRRLCNVCRKHETADIKRIATKLEGGRRLSPREEDALEDAGEAAYDRDLAAGLIHVDGSPTAKGRAKGYV